jgi:diadenylate cyclase
MEQIRNFAGGHWRSAIEIAILAVVLYNGYIYLRGTRGARVFTGFALVFLTLILVSQLLNLTVIAWLIKSLTAFLAITLVVIFQPELRRALAALGSHRIFSSPVQSRETIEVLAETIFELSNRQLGALIALERDINLRNFSETGVAIDCEFSPELVLTVFQPKTPLHDGGMIVQNDRIVAAACIFPVSQREGLDRSLGLRHRAALGLSEESDALALVVSEETGIVSICHRGKIERDFNPGSFKSRLGELLMMKNEESVSKPLDREDRVDLAGDRPLVPHQKEH